MSATDPDVVQQAAGAAEAAAAAAADTSDGEEAGGPGGDVLDAVRVQLAELEQRPVGEHVAVFDRVNAVIAAELSALDEV